MKILYFAPVDWSFLWQRPQQILTRLASQFSYDIIYVQPLGLRNPVFSDIKRALGRAVSLFNGKPVKEGEIKLKNPFFIPLVFDWVRPVNIALLWRQLRFLTDEKTLIWVTSPSASLPGLLSSLKYGCLVYEMMDDYEKFHNGREKKIHDAEKWFLRNAELVITTSGFLYEKARREEAKNIAVVPNGVDYQFFQRFPKRKIKEGRIAGYVGAIDKWLDFEAIDYIASERKDISLMFVGPVRAKKYPKRKNIIYTGPCNYSLVPHYISEFDACLIPFKSGEFSDAINPIKIYEYFALGKPVVSFMMRELSAFGDLVYVSRDKNDFLHNLDLALSEETAELATRRQEIASENDWADRVSRINRAICSVKRKESRFS